MKCTVVGPPASPDTVKSGVRSPGGCIKMQVLGPSLTLIRNVFGTLSGPFRVPFLGPFRGSLLWVLFGGSLFGVPRGVCGGVLLIVLKPFWNGVGPVS